MNKKEEKLKKIKLNLKNLKESPLYQYRKENNYKPVIGEGSLDTKLFFIGEAPGKNEAETGRPFCGRAGKLLDRFLKTAGIKRKEIYITNIVKDRPPNNRRPTKKEVGIYAPILIKELKIIRPQLVVTLGKTSAQFAFDYFKIKKEIKTFSKIQGQPLPINLNEKDTTLLPLYHPAYAIYQRNIRPQMKKSFKKIPGLLK